MSVDSIVSAGRSAVEALMTDSCTISVPAATSTFNPATGKNAPAAAVAVYSGPCRLQIQTSQPSLPDAAGHRFTVGQFVLQLPVSAPTAPVGALVVITDAFDAENVGRSLRVISIFRKTHATAQRLLAEEVVE